MEYFVPRVVKQQLMEFAPTTHGHRRYRQHAEQLSERSRPPQVQVCQGRLPSVIGLDQTSWPLLDGKNNGVLYMIITCANLSLEVFDMQAMPRPPSENTFQVAFKIPEAWIEKADEIAAKMSRPGITVTRTDVLRSALWEGLEALREPKKARR
jgi:hypothetical protein